MTMRFGRILGVVLGLLVMMQASSLSARPAHTNDGQGAERSHRVPKLLRDIEHRTFNYFWQETRADNGLAPDRVPWDEPFASVAAVGFALTAYPLGVERGWISREQARQRTLTTLRFLYDAPQGDSAQGMAGHHGFFYHFLHLDTGTRYAPWVELSSVDTALLLGGVLFAQSWFDQAHPEEQAIRELAEAIYQRVDWAFLQVRPPLLSMGWHPESGFIDHDWVGYNEGMLVYVLALGSPTHPIGEAAWAAWQGDYAKSWGRFHGQPHLGFGPLFGHQYSHVWIDFRGIQDEFMRGKGIDYFENSRRATLAQRAYAIDNPQDFKGYDRYVWGLTASDGPGHFAQDYNGSTRIFRGYSARGAGLKDAFDDGTIAPTAMLGSLPFAPAEVKRSVRVLHQRHGRHIYGDYGFIDAFNLTFDYPVPLQVGRRVPGWGWVADQYIGIDQGPILTMIANYRNGRVWEVMRRNRHIRRGLQRAGFRGGWLDQAVEAPARR